MGTSLERRQLYNILAKKFFFIEYYPMIYLAGCPVNQKEMLQYNRNIDLKVIIYLPILVKMYIKKKTGFFVAFVIFFF